MFLNYSRLSLVFLILNQTKIDCSPTLAILSFSIMTMEGTLFNTIVLLIQKLKYLAIHIKIYIHGVVLGRGAKQGGGIGGSQPP